MNVRTYKTPEAYKKALEERQKQRARQQGLSFQRVSLLDLQLRLLDRLLAEFAGQVVLKGGLALELRLERARTTGDIDLRMVGSPSGLLDRLRRAGSLDRGDFLTFALEERPGSDTVEGLGVVYGGFRFRARARLAGEIYGDPFGVDIVFGDRMMGSPDTVIAPDVLDFIGVPPPQIPIYPPEGFHFGFLVDEEATVRVLHARLAADGVGPISEVQVNGRGVMFYVFGPGTPLIEVSCRRQRPEGVS